LKKKGGEEAIVWKGLKEREILEGESFQKGVWRKSTKKTPRKEGGGPKSGVVSRRSTKGGTRRGGKNHRIP